MWAKQNGLNFALLLGQDIRKEADCVIFQPTERTGDKTPLMSDFYRFLNTLWIYSLWRI